jgi:hypothetical protein
MKTSHRTVVLLLSAGLLLSGCSSSPEEPVAEKHTGSTSPARTATEDSPRPKGPAKPEKQKSYPYDVYAHCGIKWAKFGGRWWVLDTVHPGVDDVAGKPPEPRAQWVSGYMTLVDSDLADFKAAGMPTLRFVPAEHEPPGCD